MVSSSWVANARLFSRVDVIFSGTIAWTDWMCSCELSRLQGLMGFDLPNSYASFVSISLIVLICGSRNIIEDMLVLFIAMAPAFSVEFKKPALVGLGGLCHCDNVSTEELSESRETKQRSPSNHCDQIEFQMGTTDLETNTLSSDSIITRFVCSCHQSGFHLKFLRWIVRLMKLSIRRFN